ncbi:hypothetical protein [Kitasatospora sp. NPDC057015]|uniref:hypothetical protein n=1 Tax=Kitasatospora sp. NPDC057015 TaxID=3346001 RepID=UPI003637FB45
MSENHEPTPDGSADVRRVRRRLDRALRTGTPVRIHRSIPDADLIDGFVVAAGACWTLLATCEDLHRDGWTALRTADITKVKRTGDARSLTVRVLARRGQWPVQPPDLPLEDLSRDGLAALAGAASRRFGLIALHRELLRPDVCWIGAVTGLRPKSLRLHEVGIEARWLPEPSRFRRRDITRIGFEGRYERTLAEFAGPLPA